jgi:hypothetical protein
LNRKGEGVSVLVEGGMIAVSVSSILIAAIVVLVSCIFAQYKVKRGKEERA